MRVIVLKSRLTFGEGFGDSAMARNETGWAERPVIGARWCCTVLR